MKQFIIMLLTSVFVGMVLCFLNGSIPEGTTIERAAFVFGYTVTIAILLSGICYLFGFIILGIYKLVKVKTIPDLTPLAWTLWTILFLLVLFGALSDTHKQPKEITSELTSSNIYKKVKDSVYSIYNKDSKDKIVASGAAVAVEDDILATNCHIIEDADHFTVEIKGEEKRGTLYSAHGDICLIKITGEKFAPLEMRPAKDVEIGEEVYAIGNPGPLEKSISRGIISNKTQDDGKFMLQTDAAISPGSSGGGLFDHSGKLIGITSSKWHEDNDDEGIGFVIPSELIQAALLDPEVPKKAANSADDKSSISHLGTFGEDKIGLYRINQLCVLTFTGKNEKEQPQSLVVWSPSFPKVFYIFPLTSSPEKAFQLLSTYFDSKEEIETTKNVLVLQDVSYKTGGKNLNGDSYPVLVSLPDVNPIKSFIDGDYFIARFTDTKEASGYATDEYGLWGFGEALAEFHDKCSD